MLAVLSVAPISIRAARAGVAAALMVASLAGMAMARASDDPQTPAAPAAAGGPSSSAEPGKAAPSTPAAKAETPKPEENAKADPSTEGTEIILTTRDGRQFSGMLVKRNEQGLTLDIAGVPTNFKAADIEKVRELPPVLERYAQMVKAVPPDDLDRRIELVNWLSDRRHGDIAVLEAERLAARNPRSATVKRLLDDLKLKNELLKPREPAAVEKPAATEKPSEMETAKEPATGTHESTAIPVSEFPLLNSKQINLIKVFELDLNSEPNLIIPRPVVQQLLDTYASSPLVPATREGKEAILRQTPLQTMDLIYRLKARDFYERVTVVDHPETIRRFRDDVHRAVVLNSCATNLCHGGSEAGRLVLGTYRPNADPTLYTNFYILQKFRTKSDEGLLNFENPERSALVQLGMPRDVARIKHPAVMRDGRDVWRPSFSGPDDRRAVATVEWIKSLYRPRPSYEIEYVPFRPFEKPAKPSFENVDR